ncbi:hypothetical protein HDU84_006156 [Entophlyctis sp. JEL0112]|nr:hypothetical protein HDU84_006156 [Entophlyctis sp. JEL0112]
MLGPYQLKRTLGEGEFGKVKLAIHSRSNAEVAIKLCKKAQVLGSPNGYVKLMREISTLKQVKLHPFIITLIEVIETESYIAIVMELAKGGELFEHILASRYLKEEESRRIFAEIICAVGYIHSIGIENILLDDRRGVLITDFGFANKSRGPEGLLRTSCGSPCYAAPELVTSDGYVGESADIWSCGVILYSMIAGYLPFDDDPENPDGDNINLLYNYIMETKLEYPDHVPPDCRDLIDRILVPDPKFRADINEVMNHKWMKPAKHIFDAEMDRRKKLSSNLNTNIVQPSPAQTGFVEVPNTENGGGNLGKYQRDIPVVSPPPHVETTESAASLLPNQIAVPTVEEVVAMEVDPNPEGSPSHTTVTQDGNEGFLTAHSTLNPPLEVTVADSVVVEMPETVLDESRMEVDEVVCQTDSTVLEQVSEESVLNDYSMEADNDVENSTLTIGATSDALLSDKETEVVNFVQSESTSTSKAASTKEGTIVNDSLLSETANAMPTDELVIDILPDLTLTAAQSNTSTPDLETTRATNLEQPVEDTDDVDEQMKDSKTLEEQHEEPTTETDGIDMTPDALKLHLRLETLEEKPLPSHPPEDEETKQEAVKTNNATKSFFQEFISSSRNRQREAESKGILRGSTDTAVIAATKKVSITEPLMTSSSQIVSPLAKSSDLILSSADASPTSPKLSRSSWLLAVAQRLRSESPAGTDKTATPRDASPKRSGNLSNFMFRTKSRMSSTLSASSPSPIHDSEYTIPNSRPSRLSVEMMVPDSGSNEVSRKQKEKEFGVSMERQETTSKSYYLFNSARPFTPSPSFRTRPDSSATRSALSYDLQTIGRSTTGLSLSVSEYHMPTGNDSSKSNKSGDSGWDDRKMRTHLGTVDYRAISHRHPESLLGDLVSMFQDRGFSVERRSGAEGGEYRLKVVRPGYIARGLQRSPDAKDGTVDVSLSALVKFMSGVTVPAELMNPEHSGENGRVGAVVVPLSPSMSRNISRNVKMEQTSKLGRMMAGLPQSLSKKVRYVKEYGINYNQGFNARLQHEQLQHIQASSPAPAPAAPDAAAASSLTASVGDQVQFVDEIVFYVELQKLPNVPRMCVVDVKRLRGNIWAFKKLYNQLVLEMPLA